MIEIKGITLPVILVEIKEKGDIQTLTEEIKRRVSSKLFEGSYVLIDSKDILQKEDVEKIEKTLSDKSVKSLKKLNLHDQESVRKERLLIVEKHLRSGQRIEHNGDILILGDVNKDAQVVATGNIIVMGKLRGVAIAGALGDESAVVVALEMEPQQVRIGKKVAIMDEAERKSPGYPEVARIEDGSIILERV
ncbi:MAG: septum site-determining protein MinC [Aquificaceae bacterium]|nr:septum site-determining protein MinC [Aquificaceae bacterium]MDW8433223.1 septum site-determining protein MinC [Aquificaceae bacterium]